jgi:hypothetical protein
MPGRRRIRSSSAAQTWSLRIPARGDQRWCWPARLGQRLGDVTGNIVRGSCLYVAASNSTITGNAAYGDTYAGMDITGDHNAVTGNSSSGPGVGNYDTPLQLTGSHNTVAGNAFTNRNTAGNVWPFNENGDHNTIVGNAFALSGTAMFVFAAAVTGANSVVQNNVGQPEHRKVTWAGGPDTVNAMDEIVGIDLAAAPGENLPPAASIRVGKVITFKDEYGSAGTSPITITPDGSDTIDGSPGAVMISTAYGSLRLYNTQSGWFTC